MESICDHHRMRDLPWLKLSVAYFVVALLCLIWPVFSTLGNSIHPRVMGLPWSLVYVLGVVVCNALVLGALYVTGVVDAEEPGADPGAGEEERSS